VSELKDLKRYALHGEDSLEHFYKVKDVESLLALPHPDCFYHGGRGCGNVNLKPSNNSEIPNLCENETEKQGKSGGE